MVKKSTKKKILKFLIGDLVKFQFRIPVWVLAIILLLPFIAYADFLLFNQQGFFAYLFVSSLEVLLVFIGFSIATATYDIKRIK